MKTIKFAIFLSLLIVFFLILSHLRTEEAITYFPTDEEAQFIETNTKLIPSVEKNNYIVSTRSSTEEATYLRQDVTIVFQNGKAIIFLNKWKQDGQTITQDKTFHLQPTALLELISFHHAEIHRDNDISSIHSMSKDQRFLLPDTSFTIPQTKKEIEVSNQIKNKVKAYLDRSWQDLIHHFSINQKQYIAIPLIKINKLPAYLNDHFSPLTIKQITGQLIEGLYKNYILQAMDLDVSDPMPLLLLAKDRSHMLIVYSLNDEPSLLRQELPKQDSKN